jgi:hypothetical protein
MKSLTVCLQLQRQKLHHLSPSSTNSLWQKEKKEYNILWFFITADFQYNDTCQNWQNKNEQKKEIQQKVLENSMCRNYMIFSIKVTIMCSEKQKEKYNIVWWMHGTKQIRHLWNLHKHMLNFQTHMIQASGMRLKVVSQFLLMNGHSMKM